MPDSVAVLQARTNSSRLPAKSLLPIAGYPLAVLSALRAANTGINVLIATSNQVSDDILARTVGEHSIECFRGDLNNTLARFVDALRDYDDDTLVFRLTADNVLPDGNLLDLMRDEFIARKLNYLRCGGTESGLPYGVSAELTLLRHLRDAHASATTEQEREHVTPYIREQFDNVFTGLRQIEKSHYRATIDTLDDYLVVEGLFAHQNDPINVPLSELIDRLSDAPLQPHFKAPLDRFVLGTAQLGMNYGIANTTGQPSQTDATNIVKLAISNGSRYLDTARAYQDSELVIGEALKGGWRDRIKVITKLSPLEECPDDASLDTVEAFVRASVYQSCTNLGTHHIDVVMLHRANHIVRWQGAVLTALLKLVSEGTIDTLGASVQTQDELQLCLSCGDLKFLQIPYNILDWRFEEFIPAIKDARQNRNLKLHTRSALLQGLLTSDDIEVWQQTDTDHAKEVIAWLQRKTAETGSMDVASLCLRYCFSQNWIDGVVVGVDTDSQLLHNLKSGLSPLSSSDLDDIRATRPQLTDHSLNPAYWRVRAR